MVRKVWGWFLAFVVYWAVDDWWRHPERLWGWRFWVGVLVLSVLAFLFLGAWGCWDWWRKRQLQKQSH